MSTAIIVEQSVHAKYAALTFTPKPDLYADSAPLRDTSGNPLATPYAVLKTEEGPIEEWGANLDRIETTNMTLTVYDVSGEAAKAVCLGVQFDGGAPDDHLGFDDALTLPELPTGYRLNLCERTGPTLIQKLKTRDVNATLMYQAILRYTIQLTVTGDGRV